MFAEMSEKSWVFWSQRIWTIFREEVLNRKKGHFEHWEWANSTTGGNRVFLPQSNRGFAVSGAENVRKNRNFASGKNATPELDFVAENLRFLYKMRSNETALK